VTSGTPAGAPHEPRLKRKMLLATLISAVIWAVIAWIILGGIITRADLEAWTS
jgi:predicted secreted protein